MPSPVIFVCCGCGRLGGGSQWMGPVPPDGWTAVWVNRTTDRVVCGECLAAWQAAPEEGREETDGR